MQRACGDGRPRAGPAQRQRGDEEMNAAVLQPGFSQHGLPQSTNTGAPRVRAQRALCFAGTRTHVRCTAWRPAARPSARPRSPSPPAHTLTARSHDIQRHPAAKKRKAHDDQPLHAPVSRLPRYSTC